jgi:hypothetical protein
MIAHMYQADRPARPRHLPGEIVWATVGNYLEDREAEQKMRPVVILEVRDGQHVVAGLTSKPHYATSGYPRVPVPASSCPRGGPGYLWARSPSRLCRIDIRVHAGWADEALIDCIAAHMDVPPDVIEQMRATVAAVTE